MPIEYVLQTPSSERLPAPVLDASQQAAVDHDGGPLLVLAGPGTGKTTTLVEVVVDRMERQGLQPDEVLVLTFSRKAADELRSRIGRRLARTAGVAPAMTFHSFCYALVRELADPEDYADPLRLLSAAEQEWRIQEILVGSQDLDRLEWPDGLKPAVRTRGLARELADFLGRARGLGMGPAELADLADRAGRADWRTAAAFFGEYLDVLGLAREVDYAELVQQARGLVESDEGQGLRDRFRLVVVDEYQDTDPAQVALLRALAGPRTSIVAVGDPDQSIYAFRGADVGGLWNFTRDFGHARQPPRVLALTTTRRFGSRLLEASRAVIGRLGIAGHMDAEAFHAFRHPDTVAPDPGTLVVQTFATPAAEAEHLALLLRRAHLDDGIGWGDMAVLVRAGVQDIPRLQRALAAAGVPVEVAGDELALGAQPAVRTIVAAARAAEAIAEGRPLWPDEAAQLLSGPLGGLDHAELRLLARALRRDEVRDGGAMRASGEVVAECLAQPASLVVTTSDRRVVDIAARARRLSTVLATAAEAVRRGETPEQVLWHLWNGSPWPRRLREAVDHGGSSAASSHRDLDAVVALFEVAARVEERRHRTGLGPFLDDLESQEIPGDQLAERGVRGTAVRLMTAHRSKGLEWPLVVVAGVQDGTWPSTRIRASLLQAELLTADGGITAPTIASMMAEDRRLFYVAITRASSRLVVTAVQSVAEDGDQPSRFVDELVPFASSPPGRPLRRPDRPMSLRGVVTELRRMIETTTSEVVRVEVARRLAQLAPLEATADPDQWWGLADWTDNDTPVRPPDAPLELSGSAISGLVECPLKWFLSREAKGERATSSAQGFGLALHALAADVVMDDRVDVEALGRHLDTVWPQLVFAAPWIGQREREEARLAIERFASWHHVERERTVLGAERTFAVEIPVGDDVVLLRGSMDRLEIDAFDRVHVIDFKTGRSAPSNPQVATHSQLAAYQLAIAHGAVDGVALSGGAELVHLRLPAGAAQPSHPKVQAQPAPAPDQPFFAYDQLRAARDAVRGEEFSATLGPACDHCDFRKACPAQPQGQSIIQDPS